MGRSPCCDKAKVKRGPWSPEEDSILKNHLHTYGTGGNWIALPLKAGLKRCGKSCRLRWLNYLRPDIKHGGFTEEEDHIMLTLYNKIGSRWSVIASHLQGRTDNDIKNYWNTKMKKKLMATKSSMAVNSASSNYGEYPYMTNSQDNEMIPYVGETNIQENVTNCCSDYTVTLQNSQQMAVPALYPPIFSQEKSGTSNYGFWPGNRGCEDDKVMFEQQSVSAGSSCPTSAANIEGDLLDGIDFLEEIKATNYGLLGSSDLVQDEQFYYQSFANLLSKQV